MQKIIFLFAWLLVPALAFAIDCAEPARPINGDDSPNKKYFEELLRRGTKAPLQDFLKLWYPGAPETKDFFLFACEKGPMEALNLGRGETVTPDCKPDTLYSWGKKVKVTTALTTLPDGGPWDTKANRGGHGTIYSSASAVATFGYGPYLIRYKMREDAPFVGDDPSPDVVDASTSWREYIFSRSKHFEGWSTGTPEIYDEVVRDLLRFSSDDRVEAYPPPSEWTKDPQGNLPHGLERLYAQAEDNNVQDEPTLKRALLTLIGQILHGEGRISYAPGACRNRKLHYQTNKPSYINPYGK